MRAVLLVLVLSALPARAEDKAPAGARPNPNRGVAADDWPQYYGGPTHDNARRRTDTIRWPKELWLVPGAIGQPTIRDGRLYSGGKDSVYRIDPANGAILARYRHADGFGAAPVLTRTLVIARTRKGEVLALTSALDKVVWRHGPIGPRVFTSPGVLAKGVYICTWGPRVVALDAASGTLKWVRDMTPDGDVSMVPAVADGKVFLGTKGGVFMALALKTGRPAWRVAGEGAFGWTSPVVSGKSVFVADRGIRGGRRAMVHAYDAATGKKRWSHVFGATGFATPGTAPGLLLAGFGIRVAAIDQNTGRFVWSLPCGSNAFGSPTLVGDTIYFGNLDGLLYACDAKTRHRRWLFSVGQGHQAHDFVWWKDRLFLATTRGLFAIGNDPERRGRAPQDFVLRAK